MIKTEKRLGLALLVFFVLHFYKWFTSNYFAYKLNIVYYSIYYMSNKSFYDLSKLLILGKSVYHWRHLSESASCVGLPSESTIHLLPLMVKDELKSPSKSCLVCHWQRSIFQPFRFLYFCVQQKTTLWRVVYHWRLSPEWLYPESVDFTDFFLQKSKVLSSC